MDLATLTNAPRDFALGGTTYQVSALTLKEWGVLQAWIKGHVPGPLALVESAAMGKLSPGHQRQVLEIALREERNWPPRVGSAAWFDALDGTEGGNAAFLRTVLAKHQPFTAEQAAALADRTMTAAIVPLILIALGMELDSPKAEGPATATSRTAA
jgi:hypothetical protein